MSIFFLLKSEPFLTTSNLYTEEFFKPNPCPKFLPIFLQYAAGSSNVTSKNKIEIYIRYKFLAFLDLLARFTSFEIFLNITIGHLRAWLMYMRYPLKPRSWGLRPHDRRFAKTNGCRHFIVEFLTFLDALPSVTFQFGQFRTICPVEPT